jgi:hypothetical protein
LLAELLSGNGKRRARQTASQEIDTSELPKIVWLKKIVFFDPPMRSIDAQCSARMRVVLEKRQVMEACLFKPNGLPARSGTQFQRCEAVLPCHTALLANAPWFGNERYRNEYNFPWTFFNRPFTPHPGGEFTARRLDANGRQVSTFSAAGRIPFSHGGALGLERVWG